MSTFLPSVEFVLGHGAGRLSADAGPPEAARILAGADFLAKRIRKGTKAACFSNIGLPDSGDKNISGYI